MAVLNADFWPAVPLRLATLAAAERQAKEKHPHGTERPGEGLIMKGIRRIISREHVRAASSASSSPQPSPPSDGGEGEIEELDAALWPVGIAQRILDGPTAVGHFARCRQTNPMRTAAS